MKRRLLLSADEESEFRKLLDDEADPLRPIVEHYRVSYREAYFIHKGKITPSFAVDDASLSRWIG